MTRDGLNTLRDSLEPALMLGSRPFHTTADLPRFGAKVTLRRIGGLQFTHRNIANHWVVRTRSLSRMGSVLSLLC